MFILVGPNGLILYIREFDFDIQCLLQIFYTVNQSDNLIHDFVVFKICETLLNQLLIISLYSILSFCWF